MSKFTKIVFMFPGQGSQFVGMGKDLYDNVDEARRMFTKTDELLGYSLSALCFEGPEEELTKTLNAQPALYVCGAIAAKTLMDKGVVVPWGVAGHSLGEYTALYTACAFDFETGLLLVKARAEAMNTAAEKSEGTMAAILGLEDTVVERICEEASEKGIIKAANFNSPGQVVVSGDRPGVEEAIRLAIEKGAKRALELKVSGAFHSPLMEPAAERMREVLSDSRINVPTIMFVNNADAAVFTSPDEIEDGLARQIVSCVRWTDSMETFLAAGAKCFIEVGPGKVLTGLMKRINRDIPCFTCGDTASIEQVLSQLND